MDKGRLLIAIYITLFGLLYNNHLDRIIYEAQHVACYINGPYRPGGGQTSYTMKDGKVKLSGYIFAARDNIPSCRDYPGFEMHVINKEYNIVFDKIKYDMVKKITYVYKGKPFLEFYFTDIGEKNTAHKPAFSDLGMRDKAVNQN